MSDVDFGENNLKNISPFMSKNLIAAAGFNIETPIVNAIIGNLNGTLPTKKNGAEVVKCNTCGCELSSAVVLKLHVNGSKHRKRLKALKIIAQLKDAKEKGVRLGDNENPNTFRCEICYLTVNSALQLEIHLSGGKHKKNAARAVFSESHSRNRKSKLNEIPECKSSLPNKKCKKEEKELISCSICNVFVNSKTQYNQHLISKKHLGKVNF